MPTTSPTEARRADGPLLDPQDRIHLLCLCPGNDCLSPIAEALLSLHLHRAGVGGQFVVSSAGTRNVSDCRPADSTLKVIAEFGAVGFSFRPHAVTPAEIVQADLILALAEEQRQWIGRVHPGALTRTMRLARAAGRQFDLSTPLVQNPDAIRPMAYLIDALIRDGVRRIASYALLNWMQRGRMKDEGGRMNGGGPVIVTQYQEWAALEEVAAARYQLEAERALAV